MLMPPQPMFVTSTNATAVPLLATETEIFRVRRSVLFLIVPIIVVSTIGIALFLVLNAAGLPSQLLSGVRIGLIVAIVFIDLLILLDWLTTVYLLTNRRVQFRFGIIGQQTKTIALEQITNTEVQIGIFGRLFNYGTIEIDAANINSIILFRGISAPDTRKGQIDDAKLALGP